MNQIKTKLLSKIVLFAALPLALLAGVFILSKPIAAQAQAVEIFNKNKYDWARVLEANQAEFNWYKTGTQVK